MKSKQLKIKRDGLHAELDVLANKAELTAEERSRWDELKAQIAALDKEIRFEEEKEEHLRNRAAEQSAILSATDEKDITRYSFVKAIREAMAGRLSGLEAEMHQEAMKEMAMIGQALSGFGIPSRILRMGHKRADVTTATAPLVQTNIVGFIDALYSKLFCVQAGATVMSGLTGNVSIPRVATAASVGWATEVADASDAGSDTESVSLSPKRLTCYQDISKLLIGQSVLNVEQLIRNLFISAMYVELEEGIIAGAVNGPTGILATSGIGDVAGGDNGAAPTLANMLSLIEKIGTGNAEFGNLAFATSPKGRWKLQSTAIESGHPERVWAINVPDQLLGYKAFVSTAVPDNLTKGNQSEVCTAIMFANWQELIVAQFGALDVLVDPYTVGIGNKTRIVLNGFFDSVVKHAASFAAMKDAKCSS